MITTITPAEMLLDKWTVSSERVGVHRGVPRAVGALVPAAAIDTVGGEVAWCEVAWCEVVRDPLWPELEFGAP